MKTCVRILFYLFSMMLPASAGWEQTRGPEGTVIRGILYDGSRDILFLSTLSGVYARKNFELYLLADGRKGNGPLAMTPDGDLLLANSKSGSIYKYSFPASPLAPDQGVLSQLGSEQFFEIRALSTNSSGEMFAGTSDGLRKYDGVGSWNLVAQSPGISPEGVTSIVILGSVIYVGSNTGFHIFDGNSWSRTMPSSIGGNSLRAIAYDGVNTMYAGTSGDGTGVYAFNTSTSQWSETITGTENIGFTSITAGSAGVFALGPDQIYWKGTSSAVFQPLAGSRFPNSTSIRNTSQIITYAGRVYAAIGSGIRQSSPPYQVWTRPDVPLAGSGKPLTNTIITKLMKNPIGDYIFAGTGDGEIFRTTNPEFGWDQCVFSQAIPVNSGEISAFAHFYHAEKGYERFFAGKKGGGVYYSGDGGYTWGSFIENPLNLEVTSLAVYPSYEYNSLCSGLKQLGRVFAGTEAGMYWSHCIDECDFPDADWGAVVDEDIAGANISYLAPGPGNSPVLYAIADGQLVRSRDGGEAWDRLEQAPGANMKIAINAMGHLYAIDGSSLYSSIDEGDTWVDHGPLNIGDLDGEVTMAFNASGQLYISDEGQNVYGSPDNGKTWEEINDGLLNIAPNGLMPLCEGPEGTMLAGTLGAGVWGLETPLSNLPGCFDVLNENWELAGWWSGDNHALDLTTRENDGTLSGAATYVLDGKVGESFSFAAAPGYVSVNDPSSGDLDFAASEPFSFAAWVRPRNTSFVGCILGKTEFTGVGFDEYGYAVTRSPSGGLSFYVYSGSSGGEYSTAGAPLQDNVWRHVVVTCDRTMIPILYVDGVVQPLGSASGPIVTTLANDAPFQIGKTYTAGGNYFTGDIEEVMVFRSSLTPAQVLQLYNVGNTAGSCKPDCRTQRSLQVTYPSTQDISLVIGTTRDIKWQTECVERVNLDYTTNDGSTWTTIATNIDASSGSYGWLIPVLQMSEPTVKIRISSVTHPSTLYDISDFPFLVGAPWASSSRPTTKRLNDVSFISPTDGIAVGDAATILYTTGTDDNGNPVWNEAGFTGIVTKDLHGVSFVNPQFAWSVGGDDGVFLRKLSDSPSWQTFPVNSLQNIEFNDVSYVDNLYGWMVGNNGAIYATQDGGATWAQEVSGTTEHLRAVDFLTRTDGYAVGSGSTVLKRTSGGWTNVGSTVSPACQTLYNDLSFLDANTGWVVGNGGAIVYTDDAGATWSCQTSSTLNDINAISVVSPEIGWAVGDGGTILRFDPPGLLGRTSLRSVLNGASGTWTAIEGVTSTDLFAIDMVGGTTGVIIGDSGDVVTYTPTEEDSAYFAVGLSLQRNWNIISLPVRVSDGRRSTLFPTALSEAFTFTPEGYQSRDTLEPRSGYWVKDTSLTVLNLTGSALAADTIYLSKDWNMIGSISTAVDVTTIISDPPDLIASQYFGYSGGYQPAQTIQPGKGYWVKAASSGRIILTAPEASVGGATPKLKPTMFDTFSELVFSDQRNNLQSLYFATSEQGASALFEMPPVPPQGVFDVRFASQRMAEVMPHDDEQIYTVHVSGASQALRVSFKPSVGFKGEVVIGGRRLSPGGEVTLAVSEQMSIRLEVRTSVTIPSSFALHQNFPNPFNPSTTISFELPVNSVVTLKLYNVLGQEVTTLYDNKEFEAGIHEGFFDFKRFASGVYFYRMIARSEGREFHDVKKMALIR